MVHCLAQLPAAFRVTAIGPARVVVGPTGVFVVLAHDGSTERARSLSRLAATIRSTFAERMAWVPFVHALLIDDEPQSLAQATVVPVGLLAEVLTEGRQTLEHETITTIDHLIAEGLLDGLEAIGPATSRARVTRPLGTGARLAECSDSPAPMASSSAFATLARSLPDDRSSSPTQPASTAASGHLSPPI